MNQKQLRIIIAELAIVYKNIKQSEDIYEAIYDIIIALISVKPEFEQMRKQVIVLLLLD